MIILFCLQCALAALYIFLSIMIGTLKFYFLPSKWGVYRTSRHTVVCIGPLWVRLMTFRQIKRAWLRERRMHVMWRRWRVRG